MTDLISQYIQLKELDKIVTKFQTGLLSTRDIMDSHMTLMATDQWQSNISKASKLASMPDANSNIEWNLTAGRRTGKTTYLMSRVRKILTEERDTRVLWIARTRDQANMYARMFSEFCAEEPDIRTVSSIIINNRQNTDLNFLCTNSPNREGFAPNTFNHMDPDKLVIVVDEAYDMSFTEIVSKLRILMDEYQQFRILTAGTGSFSIDNLASTIINCDKAYSGRVYLVQPPF